MCEDNMSCRPETLKHSKDPLERLKLLFEIQSHWRSRAGDVGRMTLMQRFCRCQTNPEALWRNASCP